MSWKRLSSQDILKTPIFTFRSDRCLTHTGKEMPRYYVLDFPDWVQVLALDRTRKLVLVEQYRYAADGYFLELPGGSLEPRAAEDAKAAAERELLEETGYRSENWTYLGCHRPNPALQTNRCHVYLALDCDKVQEVNLDPYEELQVVSLTLDEFRSELLSDSGGHSLMLASLFLAEDKLRSILSGNAK